MFGKKCTLCGGNLDGKQVCTECGLDNKKSEKNYKLNQSSCDNSPFTHVHTDKEEGKSEKKPEKPQAKKKSGAGTTKSPKLKILSVFTVILTIAGVLVGIMEKHADEIIAWTAQTFQDQPAAKQSAAYDPYEGLKTPLPEQGEAVSYTLLPGYYLVGLQIPEGIYHAKAVDALDGVKIEDDTNGIFLFTYGEQEGNHMEDLRLYNGAKVEIISKYEMQLSSDNAQTQTMTPPTMNPITETVSLSGKSFYTAGKDFPAGIYDATLLTKQEFVSVRIVDGRGEELHRLNLYYGQEENKENFFHYMVLPEGATIEGEENFKLDLVPTQGILSQDYLSFYRQKL